jgi:DNA-binding CsgD family transcriptional regulator
MRNSTGSMPKDLPLQDLAELTEREREILRLIATGTSNKNIALQLSISSNTVKVHLRNIFAKIGVTSRTEAALYAIHSGISQSPESRVAEPATQELPAINSIPHETKRKSQFLWIGVLATLLLLGAVVTFGTSRIQTLKDAVPSPTPAAPLRWQELAAMPIARGGLAVAVYENKIYTIGGETTQGVTSVVEQYDVETNAWTTLKPMPVAVADISAAVIGGKIYIPGGRLASGEVTDVLESYDPSRDQWEEHAALPVALSGYALNAFEGKLYVFGGWDGQKPLASVLEYDPDQNTWKVRSPMFAARAFAGSATAGGGIYVFGGYNGTQALNSNEEYLPSRDAWLQRASLPSGRYAMGVASIADIIYAVGGNGDKGAVVSSLQYFYQTDRWQIFENPPTPQWSYLGLVPVQTRLYALGGRQNGNPAARNLSFQAIYTVVIPFIP